MNEKQEKQLGSYLILDEIAEGALTVIYKARAPHLLNRIVAIKKLRKEFGQNPNYLKALSSEVPLLSQLNHPNLLKIFDFFSEPPIHCLVLEYVEGWNLRMVLEKLEEQNKNSKEWFCLWVVNNICNTLAYLHSAKDQEGAPLKIVHGDINPKNILISNRGNVKLIDLSIAQSTHATLGDEERVGMGSISYMAPEQACRKAMDPRSDIFSLGVVFFELLTGHKPFEGKNRFEVEKNLLEKEIGTSEFPERTNPHLIEIIMKMLAKQPSDRYPDAFELAKATSPHQHLKFPGLLPTDVGDYLTSLFSKL